MAKHKIRDLLSSANSALLRKRTVAMVYVLLRFLVIIIAVAQFFNGNYENVFLCGLTLILFLLPTIFERALKIDLPNTMEIIILLFIFAAEILGEIQSYYTTFRGWSCRNGLELIFELEFAESIDMFTDINMIGIGIVSFVLRL